MSIFRAGAKLGKALLNSAKKVTPKSAKLSTGTGFVAKNSKKLKKTPIPIGQSKKVKLITPETPKPKAKVPEKKNLKPSTPKAQRTDTNISPKKELASVETNTPDLSEALTTVSEIKVKRAWAHHDIDTPVTYKKVDLFNLNPEAGLKKLVPDTPNEITSLVFKNKLKYTIDEKFKIKNERFNKILKSHKKEINNLAKKYSEDKAVFCQKFVDMLAEDFGISDIKPTIKIVSGKNLNGNGCFNFENGIISISDDVKDINELIEIISHEFNHNLQYINMVSQYGKQGIKEIVIQNADAYGEALTEKTIRQIINKHLKSEYNKKILSKFVPQNNAGTLDYYINSIYKNEMANIPVPGTPEYFAQVTELEAYHIGSTNGRNLGIKNPKIFQQNKHNTSDLDIFRNYIRELIYRNPKGAKYDRITGVKLPELSEELKNAIYNNYLDANFDRISGLNINQQLDDFLKNNPRFEMADDIYAQSLSHAQELLRRNSHAAKYDKLTGAKIPVLNDDLQKIMLDDNLNLGISFFPYNVRHYGPQ